MSRKAIIYAKTISMDGQKRKAELESQKVRCRLYAQENGLEVIKAYSDRTRFIPNGVKWGFERMCDFIIATAHQIPGCVVIVDSFSIFGDFKSFDKAIKEIAAIGASIESPMNDSFY